MQPLAADADSEDQKRAPSQAEGATWEELLAEEGSEQPLSPDADLEQVAAAIERRVAYLLAQSRHVVSSFFDGTLVSDDAGARLSTVLPMDGPLPPVALSRFAEFWRDLLPRDPGQHAALVALLARKHAFEALDPDVRLTLGLDDPAVCQAGAAQFGVPLEQLVTDSTALLPQAPDADQPNQVRQAAEENIDVEWVCVPNGRTLFHQGDEGDSLYVVVRGLMNVVPEEAGSGRRVIATIGAGELVGEMAVITGSPRSATVEAAEDTELVRLTKAHFDHLVRDYPVSMLPIIRLLVRRLERRQESLQKQVAQLTIEIDNVKRAREVTEITSSDFFQDLQQRAARLHQRRADRSAPSGESPDG